MLNKTITLIEELIITIGLAAATLLLFSNVILRYFFDTGFTWVLEAVQYLFAWVVLIGAAYGIKLGAHLGIDILVEKFSLKSQRIITLIAWMLVTFFIATIFILSLKYITRIYQWGDLTLDLQIPQWIPYLAIPIGTGLMLYHLVQVGYRLWRGEINRIHSHEGADALDKHEDNN